MIKTISFLASLILFQSCATIIRKPKNKDAEKAVHISSEPPNAEVYLKNKKIGATPFDFNYKGRKKGTFVFKQKGYYDVTTTIKREINPIWGGVSVIGGVFPLMGIPILIDYKKGSIYDITTDSIHLNLKSLPEKTNQQRSNVGLTKSTSDLSKIIFPAMEIRTGRRKLIIRPYTRARFYLRNGNEFGGLITGIFEDHFEVRKKGLFVKGNKEDVYFENMEKARFFSSRLWYPVLTSASIIPPIIWFYSGKVVEFDSNLCKWDIKEMKIVEGLPEFNFGKVKCVK